MGIGNHFKKSSFGTFQKKYMLLNTCGFFSSNECDVNECKDCSDCFKTLRLYTWK